MRRPITFDVTHLVSRMAARAVTGIDRIDLAFGCHFAEVSGVDVSAAFCRANVPYVMGTGALKRIVRQAKRAAWEDSSAVDDANFARIKDWLNGRDQNPQARRELAAARLGADHWLAAQLWLNRCRWAPAMQPVRQKGIYLNIAEHWLEHHRYFEWLGSRPDVQVVFFVHDLLPFDYPEYFRADYDAVFLRRFQTMARHGTAFIVSTEVVRARLAEALAADNADAPIHVAPLPSPLALTDDQAIDEPPPALPYFLLVGTVEPRKNHLLILNIWRELAADLGVHTPRLVLIGSRGWENEQVIDMLDRCAGITNYVLRATRVSRQGLTWLMTHAQALLMSSFDEGYGLPIVEALSLGTPVIASDIPTFREVARGSALLLSPIDGMAWREAVTALSDRQSPTWRAAKTQAEPFQPPEWGSYFRGVDAFLRALQ